MMFIAVDLPEPLGPMMATNSPSSTRRLTSASARTSAAPSPYVRVTPENSIRGGPPAGMSAIADPYFAVAESTMTCVPAVSGPSTTSVQAPSLAPTCTVIFSGAPSFST